MNKSILIKGSIILGTFLIIIGAAIGCSLIKKDVLVPQISNGDDNYLSLTDYNITKQELWETMRNVSGLDYLQDYVDEIILADYIALVTQDEVDSEIQFVIYQTDNEDKIAEIKEDAELNQIYIDNFVQNLVILGYDYENPDDLRSFVELSIAKRKLAFDFLLNADSENDYEIVENDIQVYYETITKNDACVLEVRFNSKAEASALFDFYNLVPNYEGASIGLYFGETDIEDVPTDDFDETNTTVLDADGVFEAYVKLYNYMNPFAVQILPDTTKEEFCGLHSEIGTYNYDDMTIDKLASDPIITLASYVFDILDLTDEDVIPYTYDPVSIGDFYMLTYKISEEPITPFEDLSVEEVAELKEDLIDVVINEDITKLALADLYDKHDFEIFDPYLNLLNEFDTGISYDNDGHDSIVATFDDNEITADDLFDYMEVRLGAFYTIEISKIKSLLINEYEGVYGAELDYFKNDSDEMKEHRDELRTMKTSFSNDLYAQYGFSANIFTWEEFLFLAFSANSEDAVIEQLFIVGTLQPPVIYETIDYDSISLFLQTQVEEYFSLNVEQILMYTDFDNDFQPDSFNDILDEMTTEELEDYSLMKNDFENLLKAKIEDGLTFAEIVKEFNDGLIEDLENEYAVFKEFGFRIKTEVLSSAGSLDHTNTDTLDDSMKEALKRIYDAFVRPDFLDTDEYLDDRLTTSDEGIHLLKATPGSAFVQPTAYFEEDSAYSVGSANDSMVPNESQVDLFNQIKYAEFKNTYTGLILPSSVYDALNTYYYPVFNAYFSQTGFTAVVTEYLLANSPNYHIGVNSEKIDYLEALLEAFYQMNFPEEFVPSSN